MPIVKRAGQIQQAQLRQLKGYSVEPLLPRPCWACIPPALIVNAVMEKKLRAGIRKLRMVNMPTAFHKVQMTFPAACATSLLHFMAQHDGIPFREN